jgi:hypothetical protein
MHVLHPVQILILFLLLLTLFLAGGFPPHQRFHFARELVERSYVRRLFCLGGGRFRRFPCETVFPILWR